jgi:hypothetical protein
MSEHNAENGGGVAVQRMVRRLEDTLERTATLVEEMKEVREGEWDTSLQVDDGKPMIAIHGPDAEIWAKESFEDAVNNFVDSDDDWLIKKAPAWLVKLKWAIGHIENAAKEAHERESA